MKQFVERVAASLNRQLRSGSARQDDTPVDIAKSAPKNGGGTAAAEAVSTESELTQVGSESVKGNALLAEAERVARIGYWEINPDTSIVVLSPGTREIFALKQDDPHPDLGHFLDFVHPDDRERLKETLKHKMQGKGEAKGRCECRILVNEKMKHVLVTSSVTAGADGQVRSVNGVIQDVTEQVLANEELRRSERELAEAQRLAGVGSWEWDVITNEVRWSDQSYRIYGLEPGSIVPSFETIMPRLHPDDIDRMNDVMRRSIITGERYEEEHRIIWPDGSIRNVTERGEVAKMNGEGEVLGLRGTTQDITEQILANEKVRQLNRDLTGRIAAISEREATLAESQRLAHVGSWEWVIADGFVKWSDETYRVYGYEPGEFEPSFDRIMGLFSTKVRKIISDAVERAIETGESYEIRHSLVRPNGQTRHVVNRGEVMEFDAGGRPVRLRGTVQDITEQVIADEELRRSERGLAAAQRIADVGSWEWNMILGTVRWSEQAYRIFGVDPDSFETTFENITARIPADDAKLIADATQRAIAAEKSYEIEHDVVWPDGTVRRVYERGEVEERSADGEPILLRGTMQDVTERRQQERELELKEANLANAQRIAHIGSWEWHIADETLFWSDEIYRIFGVEPQAFGATYEAFLEFVHPDDRAELEQAVADALELDRPYRVLHRIVRPDGEIRYVEEQAILQRDENGGPVTMTGTVQDITERRLIEIELEKKEEWLAETYRLAKFGHWEMLVEQGEVYWSDSIYQMLGLEPGKNTPDFELFMEITHPEDRQFLRSAIERAIADEDAPPIVDYRLLVAGETKYLRSHIYRVIGDSGQLERLYGTTQDVTDLRKAEQEIRELNESLERRVKLRTAELSDEISVRRRAEEEAKLQREFADQLVNAAKVGIVVLDTDGKILRMNPYLEEISGYRFDEVANKSWFDIMLPEFERAVTQQVFRNSIAGRNASDNLTALLTKDQRLRYFQWSDTVLKDGDNQLIGLLAIGQDVTDRLRDQGQIFELSRRNEQILEAAGEGIYGVDLEGNCMFINRAGSAMLGVEAVDLIGENTHDRLHHSHPDGTSYDYGACPITAAYTEGRTQTVSDEVFWRSDGSSFPVEYTATPIVEDERISGAVVVFRDISEARQLQQQIIQTSKMATLGEMATGIAHEINQPLNIIRMAANNIRRTMKNGDIDAAVVEQKLERIENQVERAAQITDHMRIFGRKSETVAGPIDVGKTLREAAALLAEQLRLSEVSVDLDIASGLPPVIGYAVQLEQVMLNLIGNARQQLIALGEDSDVERQIAIRATITDGVGHHQYVRIAVSDNAGGVDEALTERIFEPFFTTKETGEGTGLGLSISYGIIRDMGGEISVRNTGEGDQYGAEFEILLPAVETVSA